MQQTLFDDSAIPRQPLDKIINVASVPQRSPFRYPGGKTWLVPHLRRWLRSTPQRPSVFVEPFAGGGICSLTVAAEGLADHIVMVELDDDVAAVWETIISGDGNALAERIASFDLTLENVQEELATTPSSTLDRAFRTILRNRVNRGGILAPGVGMIKVGENGKGIRSRWYPETLKKRIEDILTYRDRITFVHGNGLTEMSSWIDQAHVTFFIDPPYTAGGKNAGSRLYTHNELNHDDLFRLASQCMGNFLMTYDNAQDVKDLAKKYMLDTEPIAMKSTHHEAMTELLIGKILEWSRLNNS